VKRRSKTDPAFRRKLLDAPRDAVESEFDMALPMNFNIRFVENRGADLTVVLPDPSERADELSDNDLKHVAGGKASELPTVLDHIDRHREVREQNAWTDQMSA